MKMAPLVKTQSHKQGGLNLHPQCPLKARHRQLPMPIMSYPKEATEMCGSPYVFSQPTQIGELQIH